VKGDNSQQASAVVGLLRRTLYEIQCRSIELVHGTAHATPPKQRQCKKGGRTDVQLETHPVVDLVVFKGDVVFVSATINDEKEAISDNDSKIKRQTRYVRPIPSCDIDDDEEKNENERTDRGK
jgi:hypothetical protein